MDDNKPLIIIMFVAFAVLLFVAINDHPTKKIQCQRDCQSFISNGPDWTCVKSCLDLSEGDKQ